MMSPREERKLKDLRHMATLDEHPLRVEFYEDAMVDEEFIVFDDEESTRVLWRGPFNEVKTFLIGYYRGINKTKLNK